MVRLLTVPLLVLLVQSAPAQDAAPGELAVIDLRPPEETEGNGLAPLSGKCNDDVYRIADVASDPLKIEVLKSDLSEQLRTIDGRKTLTVLNWSIYYNKQVQKSGGGISSVGVQGYSIPGKKKERKAGSKCSRKESAGGWYEGSEIHSVYYPLISEFAGTFGGKPVKARVVFSPQRKLPGKFEGGAEDTEALLDTVHQTAESLAATILQ
jgi:hypothetical protein